jgi:hypothetical protein
MRERAESYLRIEGENSIFDDQKKNSRTKNEI